MEERISWSCAVHRALSEDSCGADDDHYGERKESREIGVTLKESLRKRVENAKAETTDDCSLDVAKAAKNCCRKAHDSERRSEGGTDVEHWSSQSAP